MDEKMLTAFGQYLLSPERKARYKATKLKGHSLKERLSHVDHADVENFKAEYKP